MRSMRSMRGVLFPVVEGPCKRYQCHGPARRESNERGPPIAENESTTHRTYRTHRTCRCPQVTTLPLAKFKGSTVAVSPTLEIKLEH
jgi:hypothetical protein